MFEELLKQLGVDNKSINAIKKAIEDKDDKFDLKPIVESFTAAQKKLYENDEELIKATQAAERGKILDIVTKKIKTKFGLDSTVIKEKSIDEVIDIASDHSKKGMDTTIKEEQQKNIELAAKLKEYEEVTIPKIKSEVDTEKKQFNISNKLRGFYKQDDLRVPLTTVEKNLQRDLEAAFDLDLDDNGEVQIFIKGKKLAPKSKDGTKLLTAKDVVEEILKENKFIKESNADDEVDPNDPSKRRVVPPTKPKPTEEEQKKLQKTLPHLTKALEHAESLKAAANPAKK